MNTMQPERKLTLHAVRTAAETLMLVHAHTTARAVWRRLCAAGYEARGPEVLALMQRLARVRGWRVHSDGPHEHYALPLEDSTEDLTQYLLLAESALLARDAWAERFFDAHRN